MRVLKLLVVMFKFDIKPQRPLKKSQVRFKIKCPPPLNQIQFKIKSVESPLEETRKLLQPSSRSKLWKVNKRNKIRADSFTTKAKDHLPRKAPCGPNSKFKIKPRRSLKKFQTKFKNKPQRHLKKLPAQFKIKLQRPLDRQLH
ncbi:hypothetical protein COP1_009391 [Malus domestica]